MGLNDTFYDHYGLTKSETLVYEQCVLASLEDLS